MKPTLPTVHDRRVVIMLQLGVLLVILGGIFSARLFSSPPAPAEEYVQLSAVPLKPTDQALLFESLEEIAVRGKAAYVWDVKAETVLYSKNSDEVLPLASLTKLMTGLLSFELLDTNTEGIITEQALRQDGSTGLAAGDRLNLEQLNKLSMIASSNDAAFALGATVGSALGDDDAYAQFVTAMNIRAEELGLDTLEFKNTTGLDVSPSEAGAVGSAKDVSLLMAYILKTHPEILEPTKRSATRVYNDDGSFYDVTNTNDALYAIPNLLGSKTGYTDLAGGNLTIAFDAGFNRPIIITVLGSTRDERFSDVLRLMNAIKENGDAL